MIIHEIKVFVLLLSVLFSSSVLANPAGGVVAAGDVAISQTQGNTVVQQSSPKAIINWQSFNIGAGEKTHFQQPQGGVVLNRINATQGASQIYGQLTATGKIILVNQAGIFFAPGSYVNVGSIIATTSGISDQNFLAGKLIFDQPSPFNGSVINKGTIIAAQNGLVAMLGNNVTNDGFIQAQAGNVVLASGKKFTVDLYGDQLVNFTVDEGITSAGVDQDGVVQSNAVKNSGIIIADGGKILMTAKAASNVLDNVINMDGVARARSVDQKNGEIILSSDAPGIVLISGLLDASGLAANQTGGSIKVLGDKILLASQSKMDVSGEQGGGEILIGGNYQGKGIEQNAKATVIMPGVSLAADAILQGNGGRVIVWADDVTKFYGNISAQGGALSGNGGFVETSGKQYLDIKGGRVNLLAANGATGDWLLDPADLTICAACATTASFAADVFSPSGVNSDLLVDDLVTQLATANITVQTTNTGTGGNGDIIVDAAINWNSSNTLTLSAFRNIELNAQVNGTGTGGISMTADNTTIGTGTINFNTGSGVSTVGDQNYFSRVQLNTNISLTASNGDIIFYRLISNTTPRDLTLNAVNIGINSGGGSGVALGNITATVSTAFGFANTLNAESLTVSGLSYAISNAIVTTSGNQEYAGIIMFSSASLISTNGNITVGDVAALGAFDLSLSGGAGDNDFRFNGDLFGLSSLTINGGSGGSDSAFFDAIATPITLNLTDLGTNHGFAGNSDLTTAMAFDNLDTIVGTSSGANTLTGLNSAANWEITNPNIGVYTRTNTFNFSNFQNLMGGSGNDIFAITGVGSLGGSIAGGGGNNTLNVSRNGAVAWNFSGTNAGTLTYLGSGFSAIQNIIGTDTGANTFNFAAGAAISGSLNGGISGMNAFNFSDNVTIRLSSLTAGSVKNTSNNSDIVTFSNVQQATAVGATSTLYIPTDKVYTITYYNAAKTDGEVGDPFYFYNMTVANEPQSSTLTIVSEPTNLTNIIAGATPNSNTFLGGSLLVTDINDSSLNDLYQDITLDGDIAQIQTMGCFSVQ